MEHTLVCTFSITAAVFVIKLHRQSVLLLMVTDLPRNNLRESKEYAIYMAFHRVLFIQFARSWYSPCTVLRKAAVDHVTNLDDTLKHTMTTVLEIMVYYDRFPIPFHKTPLLFSFL